MTVNLECSCGATLAIEDASELAYTELVSLWREWHRDHHRTLDEYKAYLDSLRMSRVEFAIDEQDHIEEGTA